MKNKNRSYAINCSLIAFLLLNLLVFVKIASAAENYTLAPPESGASALPEFQQLQTHIRQKLTQLRDCTNCTADEKTIFVTLKGGDYFLDSTFEMNAADAAAPGGTVIWRAAPGEKVRIIGAKPIAQFQSLPLPEFPNLTREQKANIKVADLAKSGISSVGRMQAIGFRLPNAPFQSELFQNGKVLPLSREPNLNEWMTIANNNGNSVVQADRNLQFSAGNSDAWFLGYWSNDFAYQYINASQFNARSQQITLAPPLSFYGVKSGQRIALLNTVEYLDSPGEYAIDKKGRLLLWPPANDPQLRNEYLLSLNSSPLFHLNNTQGIQVVGLEFGYTRGNAIQIDGGQNNSIKNSEVHFTGEEGIAINSGTGHVVSGSRLVDTGNEGIIVNGGNRTTLAASKDEVTNNQILRFSRIGKTYHPGILIKGVGVHAASNEIADAPHFAIYFLGNDHLIEFNHIHDVVRETSDAGALYIGRDWSMRGNVIRSNYIHDLGSGLDGPGAMGVYLDDLASGTTVTSNFFFNAGRAAFIGGGRDNKITNNIFLDCGNSVHIDQRGLEWSADWMGSVGMLKTLQAVPYQAPPYSTEYPTLPKLLNDDPLAAKYDVVKDNLMLSSGEDFGSVSPEDSNNVHAEARATKLETPVAFLNFVKSTRVTMPINFKPIAAEKIGIPVSSLQDLNTRFGAESE